MSRYRYGTWRGGDDPLAPPYDVSGAVDRMGRDVLDGASVAEARDALLQRRPPALRWCTHLLR